MENASAPGGLVADSLRNHRVFGLVPPVTQAALARALVVWRASPGQQLADGERLDEHLFWLLDGQAALLDADGEPVLDLRTGDLFGRDLGEPLGACFARARTDVAYTRLDPLTVQALCRETPALRYFLGRREWPDSIGRPAAGSLSRDPALNLMTLPARAMIRRPPVTLAPQTPIRDAAQLMSEQRVSSVLIVEQGLLFGLVTDRDLRNRVIAAGVDTRRPIADIATLAPMTVDVASPAFDALLLMARHNIHHVPVLDGSHIAGMVTATDLTEQHSTSAVYLAGEICEQPSPEGLQRAAGKVRRLQQSLAAAEASAYSTGHIVSTITDAITARLLQLGEARLGPAPVDYVWVAAGSQARNEQTARSDQDNCMVLDDRYDDARHGAYFKALAGFVCDGLNACGYVHCPGEMMAITDQWRQPRRKWAEYFTRWTREPDPTALMLTCVFFDLRAVHGNTGLLDRLRREVLQHTRNSTLFLAHMASNAIQHTPALGLFKGLSTIRSGDHKGTLDLKHSGVVPIVDLARVHALAVGDAAVNTHDRLAAAAAGGALSEQSSRDLQAALEFLAFQRIQHQARQIAAGLEADNHLNPLDISNFERTQLKDAFAVVATQQSALAQRYQAGRF